MATRFLLDIMWWCPWSGSIINGKQIKPHKIKVMQCANKTFFGMCHLCRTRCFSCDWNKIALVSKTANIVEITEKPLVRVRRGRYGKAHTDV